MLNPSVLVLDEAVSALDVSVQAKVLDLLIDLQQEFGLAYLFVTHDMAVVERIAHRIAVVYAGRIVEIGNARDLLANPRHSYTRQLIEAVPSLERRRADYSIDTRAIPSLVRPIGFVPEHEPWLAAGEDHSYRQEG
jgi:ABC-type glutathione transport system ATPase component